jgi:hypothetical protein
MCRVCDFLRAACGQPSPNPELIQQHVPERVVLVVADARAERRHGARVVERHPRCAVDELVIYPAPELTGGGGVAQMQDVCTRTSDPAGSRRALRGAIEPRLGARATAQKDGSGRRALLR